MSSFEDVITFIGMAVAIYGFWAALFGFGAAVNASVRTVGSVQNFLAVPMLGEVAVSHSPLQSRQNATQKKLYNMVRESLELLRPGSQTISVIGGGGRFDYYRSQFVANLGIAFAEAGHNTLIVDCDLRHPMQHGLFGLKNVVGLSQYLRNDLPLDEVLLPTFMANLSVIPSGRLPADPISRLASPRTSTLNLKLRERFDIVLFDSPLYALGGRMGLGVRTDGTLVVVKLHCHRASELLRTRRSLKKKGAATVGVVVVSADTEDDSSFGKIPSKETQYSGFEE